MADPLFLKIGNAVSFLVEFQPKFFLQLQQCIILLSHHLKLFHTTDSTYISVASLTRTVIVTLRFFSEPRK